MEHNFPSTCATRKRKKNRFIFCLRSCTCWTMAA